MKSFRARILFAGSIAILIGSFLLFYSMYRVSNLNGLIVKDKVFFIPLTKEVTELNGLFQSYQLNINKIASEPANYTVYQIQNSPLKALIESKIDKISQMITTFYTNNPDLEAKKYLNNIEQVKKSFKDYNVAIVAIVQGLKVEDVNKNQEFAFVNIDKFYNIVKDADASVSTSINSIIASLDDSITTGSKDTSLRLGIVVKFLFFIWIIDVAFIFWMFIYIKKISSYIAKVASSVAKIDKNEFDIKDVTDSIPILSEKELFELGDKVTSLARNIYEGTNGFRNRISYVETDNTRQKIIANYTTAILNSMDTAVMVTDNLLKVSFVNAEFEKLWKVKNTSMVDVEIADLPFVRVVEGWHDSLSKIMLSDGKKDLISFSGEFRVSTKAKRNLELHIMPLRDQNPTRDMLGTVTIIRELA
ncbi:MAG: hypothetical protein WCQ47_00865 [bacterium]